ncbi:MAG: sigma-70 family RNA polymerase sigma factor [Acidimicrobiia bacterium]|nr:sigma-70 family RNA polymerase sigma factor [Acidimicrobiia bacterium]MDX2466094.1 sigma-70 family RNA polymerase sigma factor [Acidimicrobiia bacterium]
MSQQAATAEKTADNSRATTNRAEDAALAARLVDQDPNALHDAYRDYGHRVYRVAYGLLRREELAQDVTQEVFVRLWKRPERYDATRGALSSFLQLDAHGRSVDLIRSEEARAKREIANERLSSRHQDSPEEEAMKRITSDRVRRALDELKEAERGPIAMAFYLGYSYRKVAEVLGVPEGTVKSRIRSGMAKLRETLGTEIAGIA